VHRTRALKEEVSELRRELRRLGRFGPMVGTSAPMQAIYDVIERVAPREITVFITGESGTGKELVARTIHRLSRRRHEAFVAVNCGAISPTLIESELFGHERGSFTGAQKQHRGYFERAKGGTLLLDEVTETPLELQVKLLRVLESGKVVRIGGDGEVPVDVRVLAATNRDPKDSIAAGKLREDLFYRLNAFPVHVPPLREREGDARLLALHFLSELNHAEKTDKRFAQVSLDRVIRSAWSGNVRELRNAVERAFILADSEIGPDFLPAEEATAPEPSGPFLQVRIGSRRADVDKRLILATLDHFGGDKTKCAAALGISLKTLYNRLREYKREETGAADGEETTGSDSG
jgi:DNA-binding NtrC family response regulator